MFESEVVLEGVAGAMLFRVGVQAVLMPGRWGAWQLGPLRVAKHE